MKNKNKKSYYKLKKEKKQRIMTIRKYIAIFLLLLATPAIIILNHASATQKELSEYITKQQEFSPKPPQIEPIAPDLTLYREVARKEAQITAYSEIDSCHTGFNCLMASGKPAYVGAIACPRNIKLGTVVMIDDKQYTCEDRVSLKYPERFDIFLGYGEQSYRDAINFGIQKKVVRIFKKE
jgi:3D (Asp-Asp-Asp) domain-containing protein